MTGFPPPSDRPKSARSMTFGLFRPVLFAIGAIGLAMTGLVLSHRSNPEIAALPPSTKGPAGPIVPAAPGAAPSANVGSAPVILTDSEPAPPPTA
eukprot:gene14598-19737_t